VMKLVKENDVKFVDFRFTDTKGKEQHVSVPVSHFDEDKFESGHAFDGSSIAGWKGIEASDMLLMPDSGTAYIDPFYEEPTVVLTCDVIEPSDGKGYDRDPRSIAKRAEAYLKSTGLGDTAFFGPEPEFFIFDGVTWNIDMQGCSVKIQSEEAPWSSGKEFEHGNSGHRPGKKGGYFPVAPIDTFQDMRSEMCLILESLGMRQRLGLAAALLGDPPVLVLDEPGNGLDPQGIRWLRDLLRARSVKGHTVFVSSHLLAEVEHLADDVVVINRGRLITAGALAQLQQAGIMVRPGEKVRFVHRERRGPKELRVQAAPFLEGLEGYDTNTYLELLERAVVEVMAGVFGEEDRERQGRLTASKTGPTGGRSNLWRPHRKGG